MTLLSTTTLSGTTTTISSIDQTYVDLYVLIHGVTNTSVDGNQTIYPNNALTSTLMFTNTGTSLATYAGSEIYYNSDGNKPARADSGNSWAVRFSNYASTTAQKPYNMCGSFMGLSARVAMMQSGSVTSTTAISSLKFTLYGGGSWSTGTVLIYGVK